MKKYNKFSNKELWNLDHTIATFILPRLIKFRETNQGHPGIFESQEQWNEVLDKMILAFKKILEEFDTVDITNEDGIEEGLELFAKYFRSLWI